MRKVVLILSVFFLSSLTLLAQDNTEKKSNWKLSGSSSLNFVQASYSNWSSGGENSIAGKAGGQLNLNYKKNKVSWENNLILGYGLTYQGTKRSKNEDKIDFSSKFGYKAFGKVNYSAAASFKTQFDKGYKKYPIEDGAPYNSKFMAPAYLVLSLGFDYKPNDNFSFMISPLSGKFTFVLDDTLSSQGVYGVDKGKHAYYELGAYAKATYSKKVRENISINSSLDLFSNLLKNPENVDINWSLNVDFKVTKFISSNVGFQLIYDDDTKNVEDGKGPAVQFKQLLGIGFSYIF